MSGPNPGVSASEPASALRRWANGAVDERADAAGRAAAPPRRRSPSSTESTLGTGRKTWRETGRSTLTSQASWASTDGTP